MRDALTTALMAGSVLALAGCASSDHVLFVTKTSLGIDLDSKPATASIAYDRIEGYVAPRYANGEIPPVVASIKSDGNIFSPRIRQIYATGNAAVIATGGTVTGESPPMKGTRKLMFFGTTTTTGLKVGFTTEVLPDSFTFGFKRKEFSYIPLATVGTGADEHDVYPSVLASIDTAANVSTTGKRDDVKLTNSQFFATGKAATLLADSRTIRESFTSLATETVRKQQAEAVAKDQELAVFAELLVDNIRASFSNSGTTVEQKKSIVEAAKTAGMDPENLMTVSNFEKKLTLNASAVADAPTKLQALREAIKGLLGS